MFTAGDHQVSTTELHLTACTSLSGGCSSDDLRRQRAKVTEPRDLRGCRSLVAPVKPCDWHYGSVEKNDSGDWCRHSLSLCGEEVRLCQSACERPSPVPKPQQRWQQSILAGLWGFHFHFIQELLALVRIRSEKHKHSTRS